MEQDFYRERLRRQHGLSLRVPPEEDREIIHRIIYDELCQGKLLESSRAQYRRVMTDFAAQGAEGIILGCTEISLLVGQADSTLPLFDTTELHAFAAVEWALAAD